MNEDEDTRLTLAKSQSENGELQLAGLLGIVRKSEVMARGEPPDSGPTFIDTLSWFTLPRVLHSRDRLEVRASGHIMPSVRAILHNNVPLENNISWRPL